MKLKFYLSFLWLVASFLFASGLNAQTNIALGKNAYSSSDENSGLSPVNATDGNYNTRWASEYGDSRWIYIDLGQQYDFTEVKLFWEAALGRDFNIEVSNDALTWQLAVAVTNNTNFNNTIDLNGFSGRYVRMNGLVRGTQYGFSLCEFEVYGSPSVNVPVVNLAYLKTGTSSSDENGDDIPVWAFDGLGTNIVNGKAHDENDVEYGRWSSAFDDDEWLAVDLGALYEITEVRLYWEVANGKDFNIEVSPDGTDWLVAASVTNNPSTRYMNDIIISPSVSGRYVRMHGITRNTEWGYSLYEFQVFGLNAILPIVLDNFKAVKKGEAVQLSWDAAMDAESRFNIQRSSDGAGFTTIGTLHFPSGTNGIANHYSFTDEAPLAGTNYYRLEYTETGERTLYSETLSVRFAEQNTFNISPNPVTGNVLYIALDRPKQNKLTLRLLTVTGKLVNQQEVSAHDGNAIQMKLNGSLSAGTYILQVLEGNRAVRSKQVVLQR